MAYINAETAKNIRAALKERFPEWRFSVRKDGFISLNVAIMAGPRPIEAYKVPDREFRAPIADRDPVVPMEHGGINHYHIDSQHPKESADFLKEVDRIIREVGDWWDKSDIMTDYFHTAFYYSIEVARWDKPFKLLV